MFRSARIKLTAWYLLIIMVISVSFSVAMYRSLVSELNRIERSQRTRAERLTLEVPLFRQQPNQIDTQLPFLDPDVIAETKGRIEITLIIINGIIITFTTFGGYFLAGRTLRPIQEMLERQNMFVTDASHELRTPLTAMKSEIEVGLRDKGLKSTDMKQILESNLEEVDNLQLLTDNLIKLTKYQTTNKPLLTDTIQIQAMVEKAIKMVKREADKKSIRITNTSANETVHGNTSMFTELCIILLDNAIKYSSNKTFIHVDSKRIDGKIQLTITDHGIGIDEKDIPHLFDRFYRADSARAKTTAKGYGLGLSIAKEIVDYHNGSIQVQSVLHKGSTFTILIPV